MLTQEEKAKIRAEMEYREAVLNELRPSKGGMGRFWEGCSHPVIVTVIGGILIALAGAWFQTQASVQQQDVARQRQLQDSKYTLLAKFCAEFEEGMTIFYNIRMTQVFLLSGKPEDNLGRTRDQLRNRYAQLTIHYQKNCHPEALLSEVRSLFESKETLKLAEDLTKTVNAMRIEKLPEKVSTDHEYAELAGKFSNYAKQTNEGMYSLVSSMGAEIRGQVAKK